MFLNCIRSHSQNHRLLCVGGSCSSTSNDDDRAFTVRIDIIIMKTVDAVLGSHNALSSCAGPVNYDMQLCLQLCQNTRSLSAPKSTRYDIPSINLTETNSLPKTKFPR